MRPLSVYGHLRGIRRCQKRTDSLVAGLECGYGDPWYCDGHVRWCGRWLLVQDKLEKAQAIVVLSGRMPLRAIAAARLYHAGDAPEVPAMLRKYG